MNRHNLTRALLLVGAATGAMTANAASAQDATATVAATPAADPNRDAGAGPAAGVGDIVVTAQRRVENQQRVPVSTSVLGGDFTRDLASGGGDILALSGRVPSVYIESTTGRIFPRFYIRGLGNIDFYLGASQPVEIIQDDVVLEHVVLKSNPVFDVAQVEVFRGPQGTLFGRNTTAGIIRFDSIRPSFDFQGRASASIGSYATTSIDAGVGGPLIGDTLAFRVSALYQHRDNWVDNTFNGTSADGTVTPRKNALGTFNERDLRAQLLFQPTQQFSALLSGHVRVYNGTATLFERGALVGGSNEIIDSQSRSQVSYDEGAGNPQRYTTYGGSLNMSYRLGGVTLTSISAYESLFGYSRGDTDGGAAANFPVGGVPNGFGESQGQVRDLDQFTQELRLASDSSGAFRWQVGGLYFNSADTTDFYQRAFFLTTAARNPNNYVRLRNTNTSWAAFGQASYDVTPRFTLTVGARESNDTKRTRLLHTANTAANVVTYTGRRNVRLADTEPSFDVSALYRATPNLNLYARVATGFRGPTIQGRSAVFNADFTTAGSERILSGEVGFKSQLLNNTLRFNATAFAYRVHDIQLNGNDSNGNGVLFNADRAVAYGLEAEAEWRPVPNFSFTAGLSLLHSEIQDRRVYAQVCALNGVVVCTVNDPTIKIGANTFAQINGNPLPNAPEYNVNLTARYDVPTRGNGRPFVAADFQIQGYTNFVLYRTDEFYSNGDYELGARIGYAWNNGTEVAVFARNLTDSRNLRGVIENYLAAVFNEPRIIGAQVSTRFR